MKIIIIVMIVIYNNNYFIVVIAIIVVITIIVVIVIMRYDWVKCILGLDWCSPVKRAESKCLSFLFLQLITEPVQFHFSAGDSVQIPRFHSLDIHVMVSPLKSTWNRASCGFLWRLIFDLFFVLISKVLSDFHEDFIFFKLKPFLGSQFLFQCLI